MFDIAQWLENLY